MSIIFRKYKFLIVLVLLVFIWWFVLHRKPKASYTSCDQLFKNVHKHIVQQSFDDREESFVGVWASTSAFDKELCSFYTFLKGHDKMMLGSKKQSGEYSTKNVGFYKGEDGVIIYHIESHPKMVLGYIYPLYYEDYALGILQCTDLNGFAEWQATVSVPINLVHYKKTFSLVSECLRTFKDVATELGVDIHLGDFYGKPCWKPPVWGAGGAAKRNESI